MEIWWESLSLLEQVFFIIALPSTLIILIQTVMLIFGGGFSDGTGDGISGGIGSGDGADAIASDTDAVPDVAGTDGLHLFSIRGIMSFFTIFGWSGVILLGTVIPAPIAIIISFILGAVALYLMALLVKSLMGLQESGTMDYNSVIGKTGSVYLGIPPAGQGHGKINVLVGEALREFSAVTKGEDSIPTGTSVRILDVSGDMFTVERTV